MPDSKCAWHDIGFEQINRRCPSSKTHSRCQAVNQSLLLSERMYRCRQCGCAYDRNRNTARNSQVFTKDCSVVADVEARQTNRTTGTHGRRSVNQTEHPRVKA